MGFLDRFFRKETPRQSARERLQLVLIHDRAISHRTPWSG